MRVLRWKLLKLSTYYTHRSCMSKTHKNPSVVCEGCGQAKPLAKITGKYYCYDCGRKIVEEHILSQLKELEKKGIILSNEEGERGI